MTELDIFREVDTKKDETCTKCGEDEIGVVQLWESHGKNREPDESLCLKCFFNADGMFKHKRPETVIKDFETVKDVRERDDVIVVIAESDIDVIKYVHHVETVFEKREIDNGVGMPLVTFASSKELTGEVEAFDGNDEFIAPVSPYVELVKYQISNKQ